MPIHSYQGVSDSIAYRYMEQHGRIRWQDIAGTLPDQPRRPKLKGYWLFEDCGNLKGADTCANPEHRPRCPLPRHNLRNGRLNQTAYSLYLFLRDLADGEIVSWIDGRLAMVASDPANDRPARLRRALREPLGYVYGVSNKVLAMALAELLLGGDATLARINALEAELAEAREQQAATSEILRTIAGAPGDADGTLRKIAETSMRVFGAVGASFRIAEGDEFKLSVSVGVGAEQVGASLWDDTTKRPTVSGRNLPGTVVRESRQIHLADLDHLDPDIADWPGPPVARGAGIRTMIGTPLRTESGAIGALREGAASSRR